MLLAIHKYPWADSVEVDLPGGKRDFGEDSLATALREMWEETGVNLCGFNPDAPPVLGERVTYHPGRMGRVHSAPPTSRIMRITRLWARSMTTKDALT